MRRLTVACSGAAHVVQLDDDGMVWCPSHRRGNDESPCALVAREVRQLGWIVNGDLDAWLAVGVCSADDHDAWCDIGATTPDDVAAWHALGEMTSRSAGEWVAAGARTASSAAAWIELGIRSPLLMREWREVDVDDAPAVRRWRKAGIATAAEAAGWQQLAQPRQVEAWRAAGVENGEQATWWARSGVRTRDDLSSWREMGIDAKEAWRWTRAHIRVDDVLSWREAGVRDGADAMLWRAGGCRGPADVTEWLARGVTSDEIGGWHDVGCRGPEDLDWWDSFGLLQEARRWRGVNGPEDVIAWRLVGVGEAAVAERWRSVRGFVSVAEVAAWDMSIEQAKRLVDRVDIPLGVREVRTAERERLGMRDGGPADRTVEVGGAFPPLATHEDRYFYRADHVRVAEPHGQLVVSEYLDASGQRLPWMSAARWLPRTIPNERVELRVPCFGEVHRLVAVRCRRGWRFEHEHGDIEAEQTLLALGGEVPRCASAAAAFRRLVTQLSPPEAGARAATGEAPAASLDDLLKHGDCR